MKINKNFSESDLADISGIPVIKPELVKNAIGKKISSEKHVVLKGTNFDRSGLLKWKGYIDERFCLGCELVKGISHFHLYFNYFQNIDKPEIGTDGKFGQAQLFQCKRNRGFLIPLDALIECCVRGPNFSYLFIDILFFTLSPNINWLSRESVL